EPALQPVPGQSPGTRGPVEPGVARLIAARRGGTGQEGISATEWTQAGPTPGLFVWRIGEGGAERGGSAAKFFFFLGGSGFFLASGSVKKPLLTTSHFLVLFSTASSGSVRYSRVVSPTRSLVRSLAKRRFLASAMLTLSSSRKRSGAV